MLAHRLDAWMTAKGLNEKVHVRNFHRWCRDQLVTFQISLPPQSPDPQAYIDELVGRVIRAVDRRQIPSAQYDAVMIDEGHDFRPEWLKLVVQMVNPKTESLLLLYDDAQSIYDTRKRRNFSLKSVGIQATGRTTVLRVNYRNTQEIHDFATEFAKSVLEHKDAEDDCIPLLTPVSAGRSGPKPVVVKLPTMQEEAAFITAKLVEAHAMGTSWKDMAVLYRNWKPTGTTLCSALKEAKIPYAWKDSICFSGPNDRVKVLPFHSSKGLEFPLVAIPGGDTLQTGDGADEQEMRLLYVAMTRATEQLVVTVRDCG